MSNRAWTERLDAALQSAAEGRDADETALLSKYGTWLANYADAGVGERAVDTLEVLLGLRLDAAALTAALIYAVPPEDQPDDVPPEVVALAKGVSRLRKIRWNHLEDEAAESLRKMFLSMASDLRVVLLALAGRVHEMRQLRDASDEERHALASETMEVYAPLANRLGIWQLKWELEDLAFKWLEPDVYQEIKALLASKRKERTDGIEQVIALLEEKVAEQGFTASVSGRPKHIYSIYKKMQRKRVGFEEIYDVSAVRVIVDEVAECYAVLGMVHAMYVPIDGEFDDYIAKPKENFYRSLHTAVFGPDQRPLEVQIRTREMHEYNEFGVAAHWRYKEAKKADRRFDEKINWVRQLMQWQKGVTDPHDVAHSLKTDIFADQIYVFTPAGQVIDLPVGATPIDFAYRVHTQVGHRCRGAKVNGQMVALDHALQTGDQVEIITAKSGGPSRDWLNPHEGLVRTAGARQKIRQHFRAQQRDESIVSGREIIERELGRLGLEKHKLDEVAGLYDMQLEDLLAKVGFGDINARSIGQRLLDLEPKPDDVQLPETRPAAGPVSTSATVAGVDDVLSRPANCCKPVPGDAVIGFISRGRGIVIHRRDCPNVRGSSEPDRWMELSWGTGASTRFPVRVELLAHDRKGLLRDVADGVTTEGVNLSDTSVRSDGDGGARFDLILQVRNHRQLLRVLGKLERLPGVQWVRRRGE
ncbi:MAG: bifunctional (p)ppGpp synthetase/guanosine-3',5'-bis(diphosphate) 3'-pyrophosphohydrolase [Myxococcota bacterium]